MLSTGTDLLVVAEMVGNATGAKGEGYPVIFGGQPEIGRNL